MKKSLFILLFMVFVLSESFSGGIVTNYNQSAGYVRMPVRDGLLSSDAVFYNPAGITLFEKNFTFSLSNQSIIQSREICNEYPYLNNESYKGDAFVPSMPSAYIAWKHNKFAVYGGFNVIGGGGTVDYENGLPSFEIPFSNLVPALASQGVTAYSTDISFKGSSSYFGYQAGFAYQLCSVASVSVGGRYVSILNTYKGSIKDVQINLAGNWMRADVFFAGAAQQYTAGAAQAFAAAQAYAQFPDSVAKYEALGNQYTALAGQMNYQSEVTHDMEVDVKQKGTGFTPILGLNLSLMDKNLNIGIKYELATKMKVKNETTKDDVNMFPNDSTTNSDMPALLSIGVAYKMLPDLLVTAGFHYYWDKNVSYGKKIEDVEVDNKDIIEDNSFEFATGFEYRLSPKIALSCGYLYANTSPAFAYQTDMSYTLKSHSIGFGGVLNVSSSLDVDLGIMYTNYLKGEKKIDTYTINGTPIGTVNETYYKKNTIIAIGITYKL